MNEKAERTNRPEVTVGEATGLVPVGALDALEAENKEKARLLADVADALWADEERPAQHGYAGMVERAQGLARDAAALLAAQVARKSAEDLLGYAVRETLAAKAEVQRLLRVVEAKDRGLAAAGEALTKLGDKVRRAFAARSGKGRTPESLTLALDGDQWYALYGTNLQEGIAGFGPTPDEALIAFAEAIRASQGKEGEAAALAAVYDLAVPSLDPETFDALMRALVILANNRHVAWTPDHAEAPGAAVTPAASVAVDAAGAARDRFHAHLDVCERCREHPMDLCAEGATLLRDAAVGAGGTP
jgi:hypothetical protein